MSRWPTSESLATVGVPPEGRPIQGLTGIGACGHGDQDEAIPRVLRRCALDRAQHGQRRPGSDEMIWAVRDGPVHVAR